MKRSFSVLLVLCLATIVISHRKDNDEVKKIVKVIEFDDDVVEGRSSIGRKGNKKFGSSSSSSSWSSEEYPRRGNRRPFPRRRPQRPTETKGKCDDGWSSRDLMGFGDGFSGVTNGWFSQNTCTGMGAVLTGFQNENERMKVAEVALNKLTVLGQTVGGLWVGATNLPGCRSPSCGPYNTFQWTDGDTTGFEGIKWGVGEPDNNNWP
ncbi:Protein CBG04899 [Caenorhabditis briggsae]|uniref:Protein CBG04899 n=1 Tax=Caenorhabditis briggsae TaxID=6238 RepID=A8WYR5_CAEBR|nr:Protein CBG04899 [Caenorhabditis briggsae]CAP25523.2 Protein CBG04899 [Caenorhabditis briggsae]